jgi:hypothetical protein
MSASAFFTSQIVDPSVDLFGFRKMSSQPAGAMNELNESSGSPVRGEGGRMRLRDGAVYEGSLVGESGGREFINY